MTESKEMSAAIRRAAGKEEDKQQPEELTEALASISEDLATVKEAQAATLELLQEIRANVATSAKEEEEKAEASG